MWQFISLLVLGASAASATLVIRQSQAYACKCYAGESCFPNTSAWQALNTTVQGNLQVALPPAAPCFNSVAGIQTYDANRCQQVRSSFSNQQWTTDHPIANMWTYWTNETCSLYSFNPSATCTRGYYGDYVIMAKTREHIQAGVDFARDRNLRLVIRNTGHDFMGRSTGYGSLIINTHSFKSVSFTTQYAGPGSYRGGAVTVGAGIQVRELYRLANARSPPVVVVGGECPTVGLAGGYIQGGGHGPMSSFYGMGTSSSCSGSLLGDILVDADIFTSITGADNALSFEVVTASGEFVTANEVENPDLFWALKGGGPSTFGVVVSVTVKTFPEVRTSGVSLDISSTNSAVFWQGVAALHDLSNRWVENGMFVYYELSNGRLHVQPMVGPNMTASQINAVVQPMFDRLRSQNVPFTTQTREFPTFFDLYIGMFEDEGAGVSALTGGRIFSRQDISSNAARIIQAYQTVTNNGAFIVGHIVGPGTGAPVVDNAIHPVWRNAASFSITSYAVAGNAALSEKARAQNIITNVVGRALRDASPNGGAYVNEGDLEEPNWQQAYWGSNYPRLYELKQKWDPNGVFYARTTPGTENWEVIDYGTRLCKRL
ncbi:unnamed protein product [Cyclocybe aegerita]|uniref:FAD-binding PCMH-type domain-containing protein n=1 Tax=Cyclocybe aegerita TaxID=1973307 RepID=A0A8S0X5A3_CYCAE|nr:unnamed protein product [Cyclocybe aegerita]